jgi:hypothetical protein
MEPSREELLESAEDVKYAALFLRERLMSGGDEGFLSARREYAKLVERFRRDHPAAITERQARNALEDLEYFLVLVEEAICAYRRESGS